MAKIDLSPVVTGYRSKEALDVNFQAIEDELNNKVLYRDNPDGEPNQMQNDLDMNGYRIINELASTGEGFIDKGNWATTTSYAVNNIVSVPVGTVGGIPDGYSLICKVAHVSGSLSLDYSGGKWGVLAARGASGSGSGDMLKSENLSGLSNYTTARINLGLGNAATGTIGVDVQAYDATLTAFAGGLTAANKIPYATALNTLGELDFKDEDNMASNSATAVPSQQSVKAYVDTALAGVGSGWELIESWTPTATTNHVFDLREDLYGSWILHFDNVAFAAASPVLTFSAGRSGGTVFASTPHTIAVTGGGTSNPVCGDVLVYGSSTTATVASCLGISPKLLEVATFLTTEGLTHFSGFSYLVDSIRVSLGSGNFVAQGSIRLYGLNRV